MQTFMKNLLLYMFTICTYKVIFNTITSLEHKDMKTVPKVTQGHEFKSLKDKSITLDHPEASQRRLVLSEWSKLGMKYNGSMEAFVGISTVTDRGEFLLVHKWPRLRSALSDVIWWLYRCNAFCSIDRFWFNFTLIGCLLQLFRPTCFSVPGLYIFLRHNNLVGNHFSLDSEIQIKINPKHLQE